VKPEADGAERTGDAAFEDVAARLRQDGARLEAEAYPGDLMKDIRSRLTEDAPGSRIGGSPWLLITATAATLLAVVVTHQGPSLPRRVSPSAPPPVSLSGLARLPSLTAAPVPRTLSPRAAGIGRAFSIGSAATRHIRPPRRPETKKEER
jgi:hypothetical protein